MSVSKNQLKVSKFDKKRKNRLRITLQILNKQRYESKLWQ